MYGQGRRPQSPLQFFISKAKHPEGGAHETRWGREKKKNECLFGAANYQSLILLLGTWLVLSSCLWSLQQSRPTALQEMQDSWNVCYRELKKIPFELFPDLCCTPSWVTIKPLFSSQSLQRMCFFLTIRGSHLLLEISPSIYDFLVFLPVSISISP